MVPIDLLLAGAKKHRQCAGRPLVTLSYAQSLDGSIAARRGSPLALSGPESLIMTHKLRAAHDAVLVGIGTVLADNPRLNVRLVDGKDPQPVVLDSRLRIPLDSNLLTNPSLLPWVVTTPQAVIERQQVLEARGVRVMQMPSDADDRVDLDASLRALAASGINSVLVEGGARVITSFLSECLVDQLVLTIAPTIIGGLRGVEEPLFRLVGSVPDTSHCPTLRNLGHEQMGTDMVIWATLVWQRE